MPKDDKLSINRGAIASIEGQNSKWFLKQIEAIGSQLGFNLNTPIKEISEEAIDYISEDEYVEVTPETIRLRKKFLKEGERKRGKKD